MAAGGADEEDVSVGPKFVDFRGARRRPIRGPCARGWIVSTDAGFGGEQDVSTPFDHAATHGVAALAVGQVWGLAGGPAQDLGAVGVEHLNTVVAVLNPRVAVCGLQDLHDFDGRVRENVGQPTVARGVPADDAAASLGVPPLTGNGARDDDVAHAAHARHVEAPLVEVDADVEEVGR